MILLLDNYDSFTYNLVDYFAQLSVEVEVRRNDKPMEEIVAQNYSAVVLSPGPEKPHSAGRLMDVVDHYLGNIPVLGICLGHQAIGLACGAHLKKAKKPMHGKLSEIATNEGILFRGLPRTLDVVRYHSLILSEIPSQFSITAKTKSDEVMAIESKELMACGIQFHPEAILTQYGLEMLRNWVSFYNIV